MDRIILENLFLQKGVKKICQLLRVGGPRVREVRQKAIAANYLAKDGKTIGTMPVPLYPNQLFPDFIDGRSQRQSTPHQLLLEHRDWIKAQLIDEWSLISIYEELPIKGISASSFYRFMRKEKLLVGRQKEKNNSGPIFHKPGEALLLDWGKLRDVVDPMTKKKRTLWAFVGVLGCSRYMMVRLVWTNSVVVTLDAIASMFEEIGGTPSKITSDNPKCFASQADFYDPTLNPELEKFAHHYNSFRIECLPPYEPQKKGKVERMMPYVRRLFEAYPQDFISLEHAQAYMNEKCVKANERKHGTTALQPIVAFKEQESHALKPLPSLAYEHETISFVKVRKDGFVRHLHKYYALPNFTIQKEATIISNKKRISIYVDGKLIETYNVIDDPYQTHAIHEHLKKPWQRFEENYNHLLKRATAIGPTCYQLIYQILSQKNGFVDNRIVWGILALDKKYLNHSIDKACGIAKEAGKLSYRYVQQLLI
jgi:hypothetical protein